jgi:hypothetical protein
MLALENQDLSAQMPNTIMAHSSIAPNKTMQIFTIVTDLAIEKLIWLN